MEVTQKLRDDMMCLLGLISALVDFTSHGHDVIAEDIDAKYRDILKQIFPDYQNE